ncbi:MAG: hypothetical protein RL660_983 [Bacteroidota bacterium]|jgi:hypothetical protein
MTKSIQKIKSSALSTSVVLLIMLALSTGSCKKKVTYVNADFIGTYVGTYNSGAGTANETYSFEFTNDTDMNVYDGTVATGTKASGKYAKSGTSVTGYYVYAAAPTDTVRINASLTTATTYVLTGNWIKGSATGQFTVTKQ